MLGALNWAGSVCAALTGLAVLLALRSPSHPWQRIAVRDRSPTRAPALRRFFGGRADAPPLRRRIGLASAGSAALCLTVAGQDTGPGVPTWAAWPVLAGLAAAGLGWLEPLATRRREHQLVLQAPQALELLSACLAAGMPVRVATAAVVAAFDGPVAEDLGQVLAVTGLGVADAEAWRSLREHAQLGAAAVDLARSVESGTMMVESLKHHAELARERRRAALQVVARSVGVRSVLPLMLCFIPSFLLLGVVPTVVSAVTRALG